MSESRHLRSVSDLYAADEIEVLLLEEIRDLEPPLVTYSRPEDIQDFEIAGSRTGGRISSQSSELDSPGIHSTVHSWDSHANYHGNYGHSDHRCGSSANTMPWPRASYLIFYCDIHSHLKTATGLVRLLLLVSSVACLITLCSSGTTKVSLFMLPLLGTLRFMIFVAVFCLLITTLLLFLDISHIIYYFSFNWTRLNAWIYASIGISYMLSSAFLALSVFEYHGGGGWIPWRTRSQLTVTAVLGMFCALLSFLLSWLHIRSNSNCQGTPVEDERIEQLYKPVNSSSFGVTLKDGPGSTMVLPSWVAKSLKKHCTNLDSNNGNLNKSRKNHWASTHDNFLDSNQFDEKMEDPQHQIASISAPSEKEKEAETERRRQYRRRDTDSTFGNSSGNTTASQIKPSLSNDESGRNKFLSKKLPIQTTEKTRLRNFKDIAKKTTTRTSVTRSEIQEYWMQGYEHVQRTDKTTANIEQWQSTVMKSLEKKKANDVRWTETWNQYKDTQQLDDAKPCSSKALEPFHFA